MNHENEESLSGSGAGPGRHGCFGPILREVWSNAGYYPGDVDADTLIGLLTADLADALEVTLSDADDN